MPVTFDTALAFFTAALILSLAPGPDNIFVLTQSALFGRRSGIITTLGLVTGLCVHTAAVALGIAALLRTSPAAFTVLKMIGAIYLLYLAYLSFRSGSSKAKLDSTGGFPGYTALYRRGAIMNITNPKVALFFLAFLPQFVNASAGRVPLQIVLLGGLFIVSTVIVFFTVAILGGTLAAWFNSSPRGQIIINRIAGCVFLGLAVMLLVVKI